MNYDSCVALFHKKDMSCYIGTINNKKYQIYEIKQEAIFLSIIPYQDKWHFTVKIQKPYPLLIFSISSKEIHVFKEIKQYPITKRFQICLSFLEKITLMKLTPIEIYFFLDATNLWFDENCQCQLFYLPNVLKLYQQVEKTYVLSLLAKFIFRSIHLENTIKKQDMALYSPQYITFYQRVRSQEYYTSLLEVYEELSNVNTTYYKNEPETWTKERVYNDLITTITKGIILYIAIVYSLYGMVVIKNYCEQQFHGLHTIGNQSVHQEGDSP